MRKLLERLWRDDRGALLAAEWVFLGTILVIGLVPGMVAIRNALNASMLKAACQLNSSSCACSGASAILPADAPVLVDQSPCD